MGQLFYWRIARKSSSGDEQFTTSEGRLETLKSEEGITAIVDYAHTPDALQNVIETIHETYLEEEVD
jgi:UDP-N-acetylmuramyl tripeptide synthase